jgi:hypothetical protein
LKDEIAELAKELEVQTYFRKSTEMEIERVCKQITKLSRENQASNVKKLTLEEMLREQQLDIMKLENQVMKQRD